MPVMPNEVFSVWLREVGQKFLPHVPALHRERPISYAKGILPLWSLPMCTFPPTRNLKSKLPNRFEPRKLTKPLLYTGRALRFLRNCKSLFPSHSLLFGCLVVVGYVNALPAAERQNIVFILTDDLAPTAVGFMGNRDVQTPNIDRIAQEGTILTNCFTTTPVCSPSRATIATSRYGTELGIVDWINPNKEPQLGLNPNVVTWMELLQQAGYATALSGKWHLGVPQQYHPKLTGYDEFMGFLEGGRPPRDPILEVGGHNQKTSGFTVDLVTDFALDFVSRHSGRPFMLSLHYREPHAAWLPTRDEDWQPYKDLDPSLPDPDYPNLDVARVKRMMREYYASVASVDRNVGRVLKLLDDLDLTDKTVVIFTSDHGYHNAHQGLWYKGNAQWMLSEFPPQRWENIGPRQRPNLFDQALRVPAAIRWPGVVKSGSRIEHTITFLDWYPTLLAMAGVPLPDGIPIRGRDFTPLLKGERVPWQDGFYAEYSMRHGAITDMRCWRTPEWKLMIDFANPGRVELYHLAVDPRERTNLAESNDSRVKEVQEDLRRRIIETMQEIGDPAAPPETRRTNEKRD